LRSRNKNVNVAPLTKPNDPAASKQKRAPLSVSKLYSLLQAGDFTPAPSYGRIVQQQCTIKSGIDDDKKLILLV
jgi:hypothetical protein